MADRMRAILVGQITSHLVGAGASSRSYTGAE